MKTRFVLIVFIFAALGLLAEDMLLEAQISNLQKFVFKQTEYINSLQDSVIKLSEANIDLSKASKNNSDSIIKLAKALR